MKCPKCGKPIAWIEHRRTRGHVYIYAVHVYYENGKKRIRKCYLGPETYTYATAEHRDLGLVLKGAGQDLEGEPRALEYLEALVQGLEGQLGTEKLSPARALVLAETIEGLIPKLQGLATKLRQHAMEAKGGKQ